MIDLSCRATQAELLDLGVPEPEALASLADLRFVNRWLGGHRSLAGPVAELLRGVAKPRLLDVGCGSADVAAALAREHTRMRAVGLDVKALHLRLAPRTVARVVADVRALPFRGRPFDVVVANLFLHHFSSEELPGLLRSLFELAERGLVVSDLRRAFVPYAFGRVAFPLLFQSRVSVEDGLVSIRRGFRPRELGDLLSRAGLPGPRVYRAFPYRLVALARRP